jgi:5'(3')-deoxyribonucleotidase
MRCFVDLDGVLVDFVGGAASYYNRTVDHWPAGQFDIAKTLGMTSQQFWNGLNEGYWANLQPLPDAADILQLLENRFGAMNLCILSSPTRDPRSLSGKLKWIQRNLKKYERRFLIGPSKEFCASAQTVLIDDSDRNIDRFHQAGGAAILVPRRWNSLHEIENAVAHLEQRIASKNWHAEPEEEVQPDLSFDFD